MGLADSYPKEKLFMGLLFHDPSLQSQIIPLLQDQFGAIDYTSQMQDFSAFSPYYNKEMGGPVSRIFVSFAQLIDPSELARIKIWTNAQEAKFSLSNQRAINLDPGLLSVGRIALATTKNAGHRIPLHSGIYVELTLFYAKKNYHNLPWTYPDFQDNYVKSVLLDMRKIYTQQCKN